ncbi:MAG: hypothetical protein QOG23_2216 [Blastocatellia bacterium]|nr:hypothetical protein [Blastocatellia bacterium]
MRAFERERYQNYANWVASFLDQCRPQTVLEIGCGVGWVLELLRESYPSASRAGAFSRCNSSCERSRSCWVLSPGTKPRFLTGSRFSESRLSVGTT